ncbi:hypothetical protein ACJX0J_035332, partial [Zea mays]
GMFLIVPFLGEKGEDMASQVETDAGVGCASNPLYNRDSTHAKCLHFYQDEVYWVRQTSGATKAFDKAQAELYEKNTEISEEITSMKAQLVEKEKGNADLSCIYLTRALFHLIKEANDPLLYRSLGKAALIFAKSKLGIQKMRVLFFDLLIVLETFAVSPPEYHIFIRNDLLVCCFFFRAI